MPKPGAQSQSALRKNRAGAPALHPRTSESQATEHTCVRNSVLNDIDAYRGGIPSLVTACAGIADLNRDRCRRTCISLPGFVHQESAG